MLLKILYLLSVRLHILAAAVWIGGVVFVAFVLMPVTGHAEITSVAARLVQLTNARFRSLRWISLGVLLLTCVIGVVHRGIGLAQVRDVAFWQSSFGRVLALKLALVGVILVSGFLHDFIIGRRAAELSRSKPRSLQAFHLRQQAIWIARLNLLLGLVAVAFGVMLVRGTPW